MKILEIKIIFINKNNIFRKNLTKINKNEIKNSINKKMKKNQNIFLRGPELT